MFKRSFFIILLGQVLITLRVLNIVYGAELSIDKKVENLLSQMTLEEKVGQMAQADKIFLRKESDIKDYFLGSLLS